MRHGRKSRSVLQAAGMSLSELHIDRAYLSSALVRDRGPYLAIFCKAWRVSDTLNPHDRLFRGMPGHHPGPAFGRGGCFSCCPASFRDLLS